MTLASGSKPLPIVLVLVTLIVPCELIRAEDSPATSWIPIRYDDCGSTHRQPHLLTPGVWTFSEIDANAPLPARSVAFDETAVRLRYEGLSPQARYRIRVVYLTERQGPRSQTLQADGISLHPELALPQGEPKTFEYDLPATVTSDGRVELTFTRVRGPNAVVSEVWLLSDIPQPVLSLDWESDLSGALTLRVLNGLLDPEPDARVTVRLTKSRQVEQITQRDGVSHFALGDLIDPESDDRLVITASSGRETVETNIPCSAVALRKPVLTPIPVQVSDTPQPSLSLNGLWRFCPKPPDRFTSPSLDETDWKPIEVPGEWAMQGFSVEPGTAAGYRRQLAIPADFRNRRIKLRFDAVYSDATLWVNGRQVGRHMGGFTPFELDVTKAINPAADNLVALAIKNESLADVLASGTQYAAHPLGGITRKVTIFAVPDRHIRSLHIAAPLDPDNRNARLTAALDIVNEGLHDAPAATIRFLLFDPDGKPVAITPDRADLAGIRAGASRPVTLEIPVATPRPWDVEHPNLYTLECRIEEGGKTSETLRRRFGFRRIEVRGNQVLVNGHPIRLRGVCRHESHPTRGRSLTPDLWRKDAELFRAANINYIRTSHYPPAEEFIEACDELGLFVEEEAPLCWIGHAANTTWDTVDPHQFRFLPLILSQTMEMIERDRNHPAIIIWSLSNESLWGPNFRKSLATAQRLDPTRPTSFHDQGWGAHNNRGSQCPIANYHYPAPADLSRLSQFTRPMLFGEYCHLNVYNRREIVADPGVRDYWQRGFADMWERMVDTPGCLGGAIWSGINDIFLMPSGKDVGYGDWGPLDGWRRPKPEYWHIRKVYSPIRIAQTPLEVPAGGRPLEVAVINRYDFTNLNELRIEWSIGNEAGTVSADVSPRQSGTLRIAAKSPDLSGRTLSLRFHSPRGFQIDEYELPIGQPPAPVVLTPAANLPQPVMTRSPDLIRVTTQTACWEFESSSGLLRSARLGPRQCLRGGPILMILPVMGGRCATEHDADIPPFNDTCQGWQAKEVISQQSPDGVHLTLRGGYKEATGQYECVLDNAGGLTVRYRFTCASEVNPRQIGLVFDLPRAMDTLTWRRKAAWSVYPPDHIGRPIGQAKALPPGWSPRFRTLSAPTTPWSADANALGTNDFRSSKVDIVRAGLTNDEGAGIEISSDGHLTVRAWIEQDHVRVLIACYTNGGGEPSFAAHDTKRPLKAGDVIEDTVRLRLVGPAR